MSRISLPLIFVFTGLQSIAVAEVLNMPVPATPQQQDSSTAVMPAPSNEMGEMGEMPSSMNDSMPAEPSHFSVTLPGHGMTMTQVEEKFGAPLEKSPEVGDPPINRWVYTSFTVYFEYQYVINAVTNLKQ